MNKFSKIFFAATLVFFTSIAFAQIKDEQALAKKLASLQSMQADFTQISLDAKGLRMQELKGTAKLQRPNKINWQTFAPFEQLLVSNGVKVWFYEKDLEQVSVKVLDNRSSVTPMLILFEDSNQIGKNFYVELRKHKNIETFILTPKTKDTLFETLTLTFISNKLDKLHLMDSLNQKTIINFHSPVFNKKLNPKLFEFEIPKGIDVISTQD